MHGFLKEIQVKSSLLSATSLASVTHTPSLAAPLVAHTRSVRPLAVQVASSGVVAASLATLLLLMVAVLAAGSEPGVQDSVALSGSILWYVFLASLLLLMPFMSRSQQVMREFALLAGVSTVATSPYKTFADLVALARGAPGRARPRHFPGRRPCAHSRSLGRGDRSSRRCGLAQGHR